MRRVAIIGGGPAGFAAARALTGVPNQFKVTIYESQSGPGGVWIYTGKGPIYRDLDTNIFKELMEYKDRPFPHTQSQYVDREVVQEYIAQYSREIAARPDVTVRYGSTVRSVVKSGALQWTIRLDTGAEDSADYVVVASGHYSCPLYPEIKGLREYAAAHPGRVTHSVRYVEPGPWAGKKVLVVGNASSGVDITIQLLSVTAPITVSRRKLGKADTLFDEGSDVIWKPAAASVDAETGLVTFVDGTADTFDAIVLCTGYLYDVPFLEDFNATVPDLPVLDLPRKARIRNIHKFIFYIGDPSLAFVALNKQVVPMPFAESQAAYIERVWSGRLKLPTKDAMIEEERWLLAARGSEEAYLYMGVPVDVNYMHMLNTLVDSAGPGGFVAERWDDKKVRMRTIVGDAKLAEYERKIRESQELRSRRLGDSTNT